MPEGVEISLVAGALDSEASVADGASPFQRALEAMKPKWLPGSRKISANRNSSM